MWCWRFHCFVWHLICLLQIVCGERRRENDFIHSDRTAPVHIKGLFNASKNCASSASGMCFISVNAPAVHEEDSTSWAKYGENKAHLLHSSHPDTRCCIKIPLSCSTEPAGSTTSKDNRNVDQSNDFQTEPVYFCTFPKPLNDSIDFFRFVDRVAKIVCTPCAIPPQTGLFNPKICTEHRILYCSPMDFDQRTRRQSASYFLKNVDKRWNTGTTLRHSSELMRVMRRTAQKLSLFRLHICECTVRSETTPFAPEPQVNTPNAPAILKDFSMSQNQLHDHSNLSEKRSIRKPRSPLFRQAQVHHSKLAHPMTFRDAIDYLMLPGLRLYDQFSLRFAFRTTFRDCLILFHPGSHGVDFIAFELIDGRLHVLFDMGSGWQDHQLADTAMDDLKWHTVELIRNNVAENYLLSTLDKGTFKETLLKIQVLHGDRSKNFDLANVLYLGGLPEPVFFQWREKIRNRYGFQGCFANFSVNDQPPFDVLSMAKNHNISRPVPASVIPGCVDRPAGVVQCPGPRRRSDGTPDSNRTNYCLNQGTCIQMWTGVRCACELTSFKGTRCDLAGTTLSFGAEKYDTQMPILQTSLLKSNFSSDIHTIGYLRLSYTDRKRNTENDEFVLGIQTTGQKTIRLQSDPLPTDQVATLLFVANADQSGDYLHVYLNSGYLTLDYDLGGGLIRVLGPKIQLNDGYYHRIRGFRTRFRLVLEVDNHTTTHSLQVRFGRQFNDQETIWLGHAATLNKTDFYQGYIIGAYYNGLLLNDLAAGLTYRPFVHVTRYANIQYVPKFKGHFAPDSYFKHYPEANNGTYSNQSRPVGDSAEHSLVDERSRPITESDAVKREASHFIDNSFVRISSGISTEPGKSHSKIDSAAIHSQVNIWLLISLSAAGCIVLCSLIFLAYRLNFKRLSCTRPKPDQASPKAVEKTVVTPHFAQRQNPSMPTNVQYRSDMSSTATGVELRRANPNSAARSVTPLLITTSDVGLLGATSITLTLNPLTVSQSHCPPQIPQPKIRRCPIHSDTFVYVDPKLVPDDMVGPWSPQSLSFESGNQYFCSESPNISASLINTSSFQAIVEPISKAPLLDSTEIYKLSDSKTPPTAFTESVDRHLVDI